MRGCDNSKIHISSNFLLYNIYLVFYHKEANGHEL